MKRHLLRALPLGILFSFATVNFAFAQEEPTIAEISYAIDNVVLFIAAVLVLFMQAGFAMLEAGLSSAKNSANVLFKNVLDLSAGVILYYFIGYGLMYGSSEIIPGFLAFGSPPGTTADVAAGSLNPQVDWFFQVVFAATAATIVSGAVSGRMKFGAYMVYSIFLTGLIYPISGYWKWGGGWLDQMGFYDFAGSVVVHAVGGFAGLAGAMVLGARIGRFNKDGSANAMPGHSLPLATLGMFILVVGWFGFNPGSQLAFVGQVNTDATMLIATNTLLAAAAGAIIATALSYVFTAAKKPDLTWALNGMLGGLVGITANCDSVTNISAIIIGGVAGVVVVAAMLALEKAKIDDPVGAFPVHGACGVWGGIATGIFGGYSLGVQIIGSLVIPAWAFITMFGLFMVLKSMKFLRVTEEEELEGLDVTEHGAQSYPDFSHPGLDSA